MRAGKDEKANEEGGKWRGKIIKVRDERVEKEGWKRGWKGKRGGKRRGESEWACERESETTYRGVPWRHRASSAVVGVSHDARGGVWRGGGPRDSASACYAGGGARLALSLPLQQFCRAAVCGGCSERRWGSMLRWKGVTVAAAVEGAGPAHLRAWQAFLPQPVHSQNQSKSPASLRCVDAVESLPELQSRLQSRSLRSSKMFVVYTGCRTLGDFGCRPNLCD